MGFFDLFKTGNKKSAAKTTDSTGRAQKFDGIAGEIHQKAEEKMKLLRFLTTSGKFDRDKMATYISMLEQAGSQFDTNKKSQMLNANEHIMPKPQSNGMAIDGYEQLRQGFMNVHMDEISTIIKAVKAMPPNASNAQLLKRIIDDLDALQRQWAGC